MKSQSVIVQFVLFFMIGLTLFLSLGNVFKYHSEIVRGDVIDSSLKLSDNFISLAIITAVDSCKQCDYISMKIKTEESIGGYFTEFSLSNDGLNISTREKYYSSTVNNLNENIDMLGSASSIKPITLTFNRTKNEIEINSD